MIQDSQDFKKQQDIQQFFEQELRDKLINQFLLFNIEYDGAKSIEDLKMELVAAKAVKGREQKIQIPLLPDEQVDWSNIKADIKTM